MSTRLGGFLIALMLLACPAAAQTRVRVIRDQTNIWRSGFVSVLTVVKAGTELEVVARQGDWYEVVLPASRIRETGLIGVNQVQPVGGSTQPSPVRRPAATVQDSGIRGFGRIGYGRFNAHQSFDAIFGDSGGVWYGAGGQYRQSGGQYVEVSIERFHRKGERVFTSGADVFELGIADTVTITPVTVTFGYRVRHRNLVPYVGAGLGAYFYAEESEFDDPSEKVSRHFTGFHVLVGAEWRTGSWLRTALEVQYTHVSHDLAGGVADLFDEHDLGSLQAHVKLLFGK